MLHCFFTPWVAGDEPQPDATAAERCFIVVFVSVDVVLKLAFSPKALWWDSRPNSLSLARQTSNLYTPTKQNHLLGNPGDLLRYFLLKNYETYCQILDLVEFVKDGKMMGVVGKSGSAYLGTSFDALSSPLAWLFFCVLPIGVVVSRCL